MRISSWLLLLTVVLAACRSAGPAVVPPGWQALVGEPPPFVALYRLRCCGRSDLLATFRAGGDSLSFSVAAMPGGVVVEGWTDGGSTSVREANGDCRHRLPAGVLPLGRGVSVPLDPGLAALVLSGRLSGGAAPDPHQGGWLLAAAGEWWVRARLLDDPPRCRELLAGPAGEREAVIEVVMGRHSNGIPGRLVLSAGDETLELVLVERREATPPAPPQWLTTPVCRDES